jgi:hypothetical protein
MKLAEFIERPAGELAVAFALMFVGAGFWLCKIPKGEDAITGGLTLVARALIGHQAKSNS